MISTVLAVAEPDKTAWYVAGLVLAAWAVIVAFIGITQPEFPPGGRAGRAVVIAISVTLVAAAMVSAVATA